MKLKKKIVSIFSALVIGLSCLSMTSCLDVLNLLIPELFGKITSVTAVGVDKGAIVSWSNGSISAYTLKINVENSSSSLKGYPRLVTDEEAKNNCVVVKGLTNGIAYTFTIYVEDSEGNVVDGKSAVATPKESASKNHNYSATLDGSVIKVPSDAAVVTLSNVRGKTITYANVNKSKTNVISSSAVRKNLSNMSTGLSASIASREVDDEGLPKLEDGFIKSFVPPADEDVVVINHSGRYGDETGTFNKTKPAIGQTRYIYVDQDKDISKFEKEEMTLYAIGYKPGTDRAEAKYTDVKCYVWANSSNVVQNGSKDGKISLDVIADIVDKFIKYYDLEENVFGKTCDKIYGSNGKMTTMLDYPTRDAINIVLTDIGKDGTAGTCGVVGYFWAKDYYAKGYSSSGAYATTNEGKYFYIDIPFCNYSLDSIKQATYDGVKNKENNKDAVSDTVISTLFHEYQHMIDFNQKTVKNDIGSVDTWYNEMLSMLCEDLLQEAMGLKETVQSGRIPNFNGYYYYSGIAQYLSSNSWVSYGTAYAFGAWLIRNYGGTKLVHEMSTNNKQGIESVVNAVNSVNGKNLTWDQLMEEYIKAVGLRSAYSKTNKLPTLNTTSKNGYKFTRPATLVEVSSSLDNKISDYINGVSGSLGAYAANGINLWSNKYANASGGKTLYGPILTKVGAELDLQPTGFIFHPIGDATSDNVTLYFSGTSNADEELYIFIQDKASMTTSDSTAEEVATPNVWTF